MFLCTEKWTSEISIQAIKSTPILFLSGDKDELIPTKHMITLFELMAIKRRKEGKSLSGIVEKRKERNMNGEGGLFWKSFEDGMHNNTTESHGYMNVIGVFWKRCE